jgi:hypothetical protein
MFSSCIFRSCTILYSENICQLAYRVLSESKEGGQRHSWSCCICTSVLWQFVTCTSPTVLYRNLRAVTLFPQQVASTGVRLIIGAAHRPSMLLCQGTCLETKVTFMRVLEWRHFTSHFIHSLAVCETVCGTACDDLPPKEKLMYSRTVGTGIAQSV